MPTLNRISPCLWFDDQAEEAAAFYLSVFDNSRITRTSRYGEAGHEIHGRPSGSVMTVEFELDGHPFTALNGGPHFTFNEAVSLQIQCENQGEIDYFWDALGAGGDPKARQCGWLKDRFGLSWQVLPRDMDVMFEDPASEGYARAMNAMLQMKKLDIPELERAYHG
jgi:predicted 3-demethylubiquinone-9 3-methyltransferase (glyoxalase superfamily)